MTFKNFIKILTFFDLKLILLPISSVFIFIISVTFCSSAATQNEIHKSIADEAIYAAFNIFLTSQYPNDLEKTKCIMENLRRNNVAAKFQTPGLKIDQNNLTNEIKPLIDNADQMCKIYRFLESPLNICILVILFIIGINIICKCIRWICC